jgi:hypothetical protein
MTADRRSCCCRRRAPCPRGRAAPSPATPPPTASTGRCGASGRGRCGRSAAGAGCPRRPCGCGRPTGAGRWGGADRLVDLGREHDPVAAPALGEPAADDLLRGAVALLHVGRLRHAVDVGGFEEVDAMLDRLVHDREAGALIGLPSRNSSSRARDGRPSGLSVRDACTPSRVLLDASAATAVGGSGS